MSANSPPTVDRVERAANPPCCWRSRSSCAARWRRFCCCRPNSGLKAISLTIALLAIFGVFSILLYAFGQLQFAGRASRFDVTKAIADGNGDGLIVTDADSRIVYANDAYRVFSGAKGAADLKLVERLFTGAPEVSEAVYRLAQAARGGKSGGRRTAHVAAAYRRRRGGLVSHPRPPARRRLAARRDAVDGQRHHPRARAPRELLPGSAARDRLSRPRAGRLLLRRSGRLDRPYERDARQLARLRHRPVRRRPAQARRHRRRRRRGAAQRRLRRARAK